MAKRNDFMEGFLRGLYQSGVGNPEVQKQNELQQQQQNATVTEQMAAKGMLPPDHPAHSKIQDFVGNLVSSVTGAPKTAPLLASQFKPDPNAYYQDPTGQIGIGNKQPGSRLLPPDKGSQMLSEQYRKEQTPQFSIVGGALTPQGTLIGMNKKTGLPMDTGMKASATSGSNMADVRMKQFTIQDLPSNQPPSTAGGAAYQVKVGARQGKALIAKAGSPQRTAAAAADLVRSITRVAPTDEGLKNANFSDNLTTRWSVLKQKLTADPSAVNNPKIRREMFDIFDEMDKSAEPFITNQLDELTTQGFNITPETRKRQLGQNIPDVKFEDGTQPAPNQVSDQDQQAIQWAQSHPLDPRAVKIKQLHGIR